MQNNTCAEGDLYIKQPLFQLHITPITGLCHDRTRNGLRNWLPQRKNSSLREPPASSALSQSTLGNVKVPCGLSYRKLTHSQTEGAGGN